MSLPALDPHDYAEVHVAPPAPGGVVRYFLDTEFIDDGHRIDLVSLGCVCEDGREFYAQNAGADLSRAHPWVEEHVLRKLAPCPDRKRHLEGRCTCPWRWPRAIAADLRAFVAAPGGSPVFWGYYAAYDWVAVCQLYGRMLDLPDGWPRYIRDIKQWADQLGGVRLPKQDPQTEHHALEDARWTRDAWRFLSSGVWSPRP